MTKNIDHFMYAGRNLEDLCSQFAGLSGIQATPGGSHPTLGTHNRLLGSGSRSQTYLELIAPDHSTEVRSEMRSSLEALSRPQLHRLIMRCTSMDFSSLAAAYRKAGIDAPVHDLQRLTPDGGTLSWRLMIPGANPYGLFAPFFIDWLDSPHPSQGLDARLSVLDCEAGHPQAEQLAKLWKDLGVEIALRSADVPYMRVLLDTPRGIVALTSESL